MSSSVFGDSSSYSPGVSIGMPVDADAFLANYANKKGRVRKKDIKAFREGGGDMQGLRDALEGKAPSDDFVGPVRQYKVNDNVMQNVRNAAPSMNNVRIDMIPESETTGQINMGDFINEFANARGRISKADMKAFEKAGGDLTRLDKELQKGGFTRDEVKAVEENLNRRGTAIKAGNDDYYTGNAGKSFLDKKLKGMGVDVDTQQPALEETTTGGGGGTTTGSGSDTPAEKIIDEITGGGDTTTGGGTGDTSTGTGDTGTGTGGGTTTDSTTDLSNIDPSSGFPYNPGTHHGEPFTNYKENITGILDHTDERLAAIRENSPRTTPEDTLTYSYTQQLPDGGVLPGTDGYVSAADKDAARLEGDLAIKDAFSDAEMDKRRDQRAADLEMLRDNATERRQQKSDELWGEDGRYAAMREMQDKYMLRPEDYLPAITQMNMPDPEDVIGEPPKEKKDKKDKDKTYGGMDDLPDKPKKESVEIPDLFTTKTTKGQSPPDDFKKNPSFDGSKDFDEFLRRAEMGGDAAKLYNALKDAGLSDKEMYKGAQYAGITNLRTGDKSIKNDIKAIKHAVDNNYYKGWDGKSTSEKVLKDQQDLMKWYKSQGGELPLKVLERKAGYKSYDSENDAAKLANVMQNQLRKAGIKGDVDPEAMSKFQRDMDKLEEKFDGKYKWKNYQQALKDNSAADVNDWLAEYMKLGGKVNKKVRDAMLG